MLIYTYQQAFLMGITRHSLGHDVQVLKVTTCSATQFIWLPALSVIVISLYIGAPHLSMSCRNLSCLFLLNTIPTTMNIR